MKFLLFVATISFTAISFLFVSSHLNARAHLNARDVGNRLGGDENIAIIANPISVKASRTVGSLKPESSRFPDDFYRKSGDAILVSTDLAMQLSKVLLNDHSYPHYNGTMKDCAPEPGVVVTFSNEKKDVDIFFCFECAILIVKTDGKATSDGLQSDFDPSRAELVRIVKKIFPKDSQIQSLNEQK